MDEGFVVVAFDIKDLAYDGGRRTAVDGGPHGDDGQRCGMESVLLRMDNGTARSMTV
jgi:hypothetical protein